MFRPWRKEIDLSKRILEIGPLYSPNIRKEEGIDVSYTDIRSTEDVKNFYKAYPDVPNNEIVDIDYVIGDGTYAECFKNVEKFDYIIATHVIEHIPQLIFFFQDIPHILNPKGRLCLTIPYKRYCFDHFRCSTSFAESYDIYMRGTKNCPSRILDFFMNFTPENDAAYWWKNQNSFDHIAPVDTRFASAKDAYAQAMNGTYFDAHFSVFTPETFLMFLYNMLHSDLLPFKCVSFCGTEVNTHEFNCVLEFEPKLLSTGAEREKENENILNLLNDNYDSWENKNLLKKNENLLMENKKLQDLVAAMQNSRTYRLAAIFKKVTAFVAPPGSKRRKIAKYVFRMLK